MTHQDRISAALKSLDGLSVGDAFGECFFSISQNALSLQLHLDTQTLPNLRWRWTDDTAMAVSVLEVLIRRGTIDQDELAQAFARRYAADDRRGYGGTAHGILLKIGAGLDWRDVAPAVLSGMGSLENGGAMRAAPLGAFFADDPARVVEEAKHSAEVTHAHAEGQAGAVGVALASAFFASRVRINEDFNRREFFAFILGCMPDSETRAGVAQVRDMPSEYAIETITSVVGNGSTLTAPKTVPFCLWCIAKHPTNFEQAMWTTVAGGGDIDTNCAIVGGIISANPRCPPPAEWLARRETLPSFDD